MRITQGAFSFLPDLTDEQIARQIQYALDNGWAVSIESTDDPHPRNTFWELYALPSFDARDAAPIMRELQGARELHPCEYLRVAAYDASPNRQTTALSFIVQRPPREPGFRLDRQALPGRTERFALHGYAADRPAGSRYD